MLWHGSSYERQWLHFTAEDSYATEGMKGVDTIRIYAERQTGKKLTEQRPKPSTTKRRDCFTRCPKPGYSMAS